METGAKLNWEFPEMKGTMFPVQVVEVLPNEKISFNRADENNHETLATITLTTLSNNDTRVRIVEESQGAD